MEVRRRHIYKKSENNSGIFLSEQRACKIEEGDETHDAQAQRNQTTPVSGKNTRIKQSSTQVFGIRKAWEDPSVRTKQDPLARCAPSMVQAGNYARLQFRE